MITPLREKWGIALRVEAEKTPYGVIRRLFGYNQTALLMPCLALFQFQQR